MQEDDEPPVSNDAFAKLLAGDIEGFDAAFQQRLRGPLGADIRQAHLLEVVATKLFSGDFDKAARLLTVPTTALGGHSMLEAAATHDGMVQAKALTERLEAAGFGEGEYTLAVAAHQMRLGEANLLLDLLPAAWGMTDHDFEQILRVKPGWMRARRNHEVGLGPDVRARLKRLLQFQNALTLIARPNGYAETWRRPWKSDSPIGARSIWDAYQQDGDAVFDIVETFAVAAH